jgi:adenine phosphoribosyltransferase
MIRSATQFVSELTRVVPDFPRAGILFRDLSPVFADAQGLEAVIDDLVARFSGTFDVIAGVEARGFVLASAAAYAAGVGTVMIRKAGKLPGTVLTESYALEYGVAELEVQPALLPPGCRVLVLDDVLATGGTLAASLSLIERAGWTVAGVGVVLELSGLGGRAALAGRDIHAIQVA